ncbi:MAG: L,D-transpeptidase YbiS [Paraglaciecola sp.]|jgi:L,D-transpeptidase YbiS
MAYRFSFGDTQFRHKNYLYQVWIQFKRLGCIVVFGVVMMASFSTLSAVYTLPEQGTRLIGENEFYEVKTGDYFHAIAQRHNVGLLALMASNPGIDPFLPTPGIQLRIPSGMLLPDVPYRGIVINLPELRLYFFPREADKVYVFPIGIGRIGRGTPLMLTKVKARILDPSWTPNKRIREDYFSKHGHELPRVVPAGEDNPLGKHALQLAYGRSNYLIHGTNNNFGIGMRVSAGCIRMNPDDIAWLFEQVSIGEPVRVINQAIKMSTEANGDNLIEVHTSLSKQNGEAEYNLKTVDRVSKFVDKSSVDRERVKKALLLHSGLPVNVDI